MAKKTRNKKTSVFIALEGKREKTFLYFLQSLFDPDKKINLNIHPDLGGTSNAILDRVLKAPGYDKIYAWFDEDDKLDSDRKCELGKRWMVEINSDIEDKNLQSLNTENRRPVLIVSNPLSIEGLLIRLFEHKIPNFKEPVFEKENLKENKKMMKSAVKGIFDAKDEAVFYKENLSKEYILDRAEEIEELKLLLSIFKT